MPYRPHPLALDAGANRRRSFKSSMCSCLSRPRAISDEAASFGKGLALGIVISAVLWLLLGLFLFG